MRCGDCPRGEGSLFLCEEQSPPGSVWGKARLHQGAKETGTQGCAQTLASDASNGIKKQLGLELLFLTEFVGAFHVQLQVAAGLTTVLCG